MNKTSKANAFLAALSPEAIPANEFTPTVKAGQGTEMIVETTPKTTRKQAGRKHIGGYFERDMVEKVAILRARLGLDNSELIKLAVEDLYKKHEAKRAFGDA
ncbi:MAG: hypothetical protein PHR16_17620 [Methylovulum sp.]|jgi:hypothetical protein|nr:hypothetical protein [Methylovulum sp.]